MANDIETGRPSLSWYRGLSGIAVWAIVVLSQYRAVEYATSLFVLTAFFGSDGAPTGEASRHAAWLLPMAIYFCFLALAILGLVAWHRRSPAFQAAGLAIILAEALVVAWVHV